MNNIIVMKCKADNKWYSAKIALTYLDDGCVMKILSLSQIENTGSNTLKKIKDIFQYTSGSDSINMIKYKNIILKLQEKIISKFKIERLIYR